MLTKQRKLTVNERLESQVRKQMDRRFEKFQITERMRCGIYRSWYCAEPNCWDCSFTVTTVPGQLIVTGDLGELIVARAYDMLPWCRGSCESTSYFAEKVPHAIPTTEFSRDVLREWIKNELSEIRERRHADDSCENDESNRALLIETLQSGFDDHGEEYFRELLWPLYDGSDSPDWDIWKHRFLVLREAVRWFVQHHDEPAIPDNR